MRKKGRGKAMFSVVSIGDKFVRCSANIDFDKGKAEFSVSTNFGGEYRHMVFSDFAKAAREYHKIAKQMEMAAAA